MQKIITTLILFLSCILRISTASATIIEARQFSSVQQEETYHQLTNELRCPQCQNNNIADSNAAIATDMRDKVFTLLQQGKSKNEIIDYMVQRYGNFVTYSPPFNASTVILWALPAFLLIFGLSLLLRRNTKKESDRTLDNQRLSNILGEKNK